MAFRLLDQKPQYRNALGELLAGGSLNFYITATSTPKNVFSDKTLGTSLGSTITLDSDGRHSEDIWLAEDAAYRIIAKDSEGVTVWQLEDVRSVDSAAAATAPDASDGSDGQALFTDGTAGGWYFDDVLTIPSQTGNAGKYLGTDGEALAWESFPEAAEAAAVESTASASGSIIVGGVMIVWGTDTCPTASSTLFSTKSVTFGTAFSGTAYAVVCTPTSTGVSNNNPPDDASISATSISSSGFTARAFVGAENSASTISITSTIGFTYIAIGPAPA